LLLDQLGHSPHLLLVEQRTAGASLQPLRPGTAPSPSRPRPPSPPRLGAGPRASQRAGPAAVAAA
jgi:hypothetical protein